jgi:hypothetical protein
VNENPVSRRLITVFDPPTEETCYINYESCHHIEGQNCNPR